MITDKLASYAVAGRETMPGVEHRRHKGLNNRAENSHQPTRRREKIMKRRRGSLTLWVTPEALPSGRHQDVA